jgi:hypothetical protein
VILASPRAFLVVAAAYYPALTLVVAFGSWAAGKPVDGRTVLTFLSVTAIAGALVASLLRRQIVAAKGAKLVLVAILGLVFLTPLVVLPDLLFGLSGLGPRLDFQQSVIALLVATLATSLNPVLWLVASGWVLLLRTAARAAGPAAAPAAT